ncbi:MAG: prepilin-type N-terminal cleavage/methylation domain-containing protein [Magnetococcales bacterium]|nr:prepilin-type N-terminal cleavage/methylation domain-containing protein [Magnetococcales bacterium]
MNAPRSDTGFTLLEMIITMIVMVILFALGGQILATGFRSYFTTSDLAPLPAQAEMAMERMWRELRDASWLSVCPAGCSSGTSNSIALTHATTGVAYSFTEQTVTGIGTSIYMNDAPLMDNLEAGSLAFTIDTTRQLVTINFRVRKALTISSGGSAAILPLRSAVLVQPLW